MLLILWLASFSLTYNYQKYLDFTRFTWHSVKATVVSQREVLIDNKYRTYYSMRNNDMSFTTHTNKAFKVLQGRSVRLSVLTANISFIDYLRGFHSLSRFESLEQAKSSRFRLLQSIKQQHKQSELANLYGALFLAEKIEAHLRDKLTALGVNHLAAISGFHLGFLSFFILLFLNTVYKPFHSRYLPFRNKQKDIMLLTLVILFAYLSFLQFPPSLLRAYTMLLIGFILYDRHLLILSFSNLLLTSFLLISLFPSLLFSIAFYLSVLGVFQIFLLLKHFKDISKIALFFLLHIGVYLLMIPWILFIFTSFSDGQLFSPLLSMIFIVFYPLSIFFSFIGLGDIFDSSLLLLLEKDFINTTISINSSLFISYIALSLACIFSKRLLTATLALLLISVSILAIVT